MSFQMATKESMLFHDITSSGSQFQRVGIEAEKERVLECVLILRTHTATENQMKIRWFSLRKS